MKVISDKSLVSRDVPPYAVVAGNPARVVKIRFDAQVVERLVGLKWWNWSEREIEKAMPELLYNQIQLSLEKADRGDYR